MRRLAALLASLIPADGVGQQQEVAASLAIAIPSAEGMRLADLPISPCQGGAAHPR
jgi:hypothetical protein